MIECLEWPIGVCTWSLGNDFAKIRELSEKTGLDCVHLAVAPALGDGGAGYLEKVDENGLTVTATMINFPQEDYSTLESIRATGGIVPDEFWQPNRDATFKSIELTSELDVKFLSTHVGFIDMQDLKAAEQLLGRVRVLADHAQKNGVVLLMETGQETAQELCEFLEQVSHPAVAVNFDPANLILYDKGDPIEAVKILAPWIEHIHIKDALRTQTPGTWGSEAPWGRGQVDSQRFLKTLRQIGFGGALAVEREAGDDRMGDIKSAIDKLKNFKG